MTLARLVDHDAPLPDGAERIAITGMTADSRAVKPGFIFAALPGTKVDGAKFIPMAIANGAVAVLCGPDAHEHGGVTSVHAMNPRQLFSRMAARFFGKQPEMTVAVTGTNGKTSVAAFTREIWTELGHRAASLGTVGVVGPSGAQYLAHTTPDPVTLHETLAKLADDNVDKLALEASSHGLAQYRLDGVKLAAAAFTNLTRDHLDYHTTVEGYFNAKMRLFEELLPNGAPAIINADAAEAKDVAARCRRLRIFTVGHAGDDLKLLSSQRDGFGQRLEIAGRMGRHSILLPLVGDFQASNALVAAGLVVATGGDETRVLKALEHLKGAKGRLDLVAKTDSGAPIFVDYAHTPDALENAIVSLRPYVRGKLAVVFGCGGDRDKGKRPIMGGIAARHADIAYVTDDNPRTETPAMIRSEIMAACPGGIEIGDRAEAIRIAVSKLAGGDVLLVAGKGHEEGQTIGATVIPFSDHDAVKAAVRGEDYHG